MEALIDIEKRRVIRVGDLVLKGECNRCSKCCKFKCEHLIHETLNGKPTTRCGIQHLKPFGCVIYPMPDDKTPEGCGFWWEKE